MRFRNINMLGVILALLTGIIISPGVARSDEYSPAGAGMGRVTYVEGDTLFNSRDTNEWAVISPNYPLRDGDRLWAGEDSKIEAKFTGGGTAWLNYQTELDVVRLSRDENGDSFQLALTAGEASFSVKSFGALDSVFQVDTPNASVRAYGKAGFRITTLDDGTTQVGVRRGQVEVETEGGVIDVNKGDMLEVSPDGGTRISALPPKDDWDDWVSERGRPYDRPARSARYLPREMSDYSHEFDEGGSWSNYPDYGYVWVPSVEVGWSPYSNGRWVWIGGDYVWLAYDPWYAPFHYGRWRWDVNIGWFWAPPLPGVVFWAPAYVGWCWGPETVSWVPLAPGEIYYGYGNYGPYSVNVYKTKVVNVTNVYVNSTVTNSVVVVNKQNFLQGNITRVNVTARQNPFVNQGAMGTRIIGRPPVQELKPIKATMLPRPQAKVAPNVLPPARIQEQPKFIQQRGVVRGEVKSAFQPARTPPAIKQIERVKPAPRETGRRAPLTAPGQPAAPKPPIIREKRAPEQAPGMEGYKFRGTPQPAPKVEQPPVPGREIEKRPRFREVPAPGGIETAPAPQPAPKRREAAPTPAPGVQEAPAQAPRRGRAVETPSVQPAPQPVPERVIKPRAIPEEKTRKKEEKPKNEKDKEKRKEE